MFSPLPYPLRIRCVKCTEYFKCVQYFKWKFSVNFHHKKKKIILPIKEQIQRSVSSENHQHWWLQALSMIPVNNCSYLQFSASMHIKCILLVHQKKKTWYCKEWTDTTEVVKGFQMFCLENIWKHLLLLEVYEDHKLKTKKVSMLTQFGL